MFVCLADCDLFCFCFETKLKWFFFCGFFFDILTVWRDCVLRTFNWFSLGVLLLYRTGGRESEWELDRGCIELQWGFVLCSLQLYGIQLCGSNRFFSNRIQRQGAWSGSWIHHVLSLLWGRGGTSRASAGCAFGEGLWGSGRSGRCFFRWVSIFFQVESQCVGKTHCGSNPLGAVLMRISQVIDSLWTSRFEGSSGAHVLKWKAKEEGTALVKLGFRSGSTKKVRGNQIPSIDVSYKQAILYSSMLHRVHFCFGFLVDQVPSPWQPLYHGNMDSPETPWASCSSSKQSSQD